MPVVDRERKKNQTRPRTLRGVFEKGVVEGRFMSAGSESAVIGAQLKLWISFSSVFFALFMQQLCCCLHQQRSRLCFPTVSMRLRPKRTCSGVDCFGGFHIKRFFYLLLFFRGPLT